MPSSQIFKQLSFPLEFILYLTSVPLSRYFCTDAAEKQEIVETRDTA